MMTVDELPEQLRALHRPGDPLPTWHDPHEINTWGWPYHRRLHFDRYIRGEYLGGVDEIEDKRPRGATAAQALRPPEPAAPHRANHR